MRILKTSPSSTGAPGVDHDPLGARGNVVPRGSRGEHSFCHAQTPVTVRLRIESAKFELDFFLAVSQQPNEPNMTNSDGLTMKVILLVGKDWRPNYPVFNTRFLV